MGQSTIPKPRRDSFPAFDVIHLGKCSTKILQEPKDQDTVPTLNLGMHIKKLGKHHENSVLRKWSLTTVSAEISVDIFFVVFFDHFCNGDSVGP